MFELYLFIIIITLHLLMENDVWCFIIVYYAEGSKTWSLTKDIIKSSKAEWRGLFRLYRLEFPTYFQSEMKRLVGEKKKQVI